MKLTDLFKKPELSDSIKSDISGYVDRGMQWTNDPRKMYNLTVNKFGKSSIKFVTSYIQKNYT